MPLRQRPARICARPSSSAPSLLAIFSAALAVLVASQLHPALAGCSSKTCTDGGVWAVSNCNGHESRTCQTCTDGCESCYSSSCTSCAAGYRSVTVICGWGCLRTFCKTCSSLGCTSCYTSDQCDACIATKFLYNNQCYDICPSGTEPHASSNVCVSLSGSAHADAASDTEEQADGTILTGDSTLDIGANWVGLAFNSITVPRGAYVTSASIEFRADDSDSSSVAVQIFTDKRFNPPSLTAQAGDLSSRPRSSQTAKAWSIPGWSNYQKYTTPNFNEAVDDVVADPAWPGSGSIVVLISRSASGRRGADSRDRHSGFDPELSVTYAPCHSSTCSTCSRNGCTSCKPDTPVLIGNTCGTQAQCAGYVTSSSTCGSCSSTCATCSGPGPNDCLTCSGSLPLKQGSTCVASCGTGFYQGTGENSGTCLACHGTCASCSGHESDECTACYLESARPLLQDAECVASCTDGYFRQTSPLRCQECDPRCQRCFGPGKNSCTACRGINFLAGTLCDPDCPAHTFKDDDKNTCVQCHGSCLTCDGPLADDCESCGPGLVLSDGACLSSCTEPNEYEDGGECKPCSTSCAECDGPSASSCLACNSGQLLQQGECVATCGDSFYKEGDTCQPCHDDCLTCDGPGADACTACGAAAAYLQGGSCTTQCNPGFFSDPETTTLSTGAVVFHNCVQCDLSCRECDGTDDNECLACYADEPYLVEGYCLAACPSRKYPTGPSTCGQCSLACDNCHGSGADKCDSCQRGLKLLNATCLADCPEGTFHNGHGVCAPCSPASCTACSSPEGTCTRCNLESLAGFLKDGTCVSDCGAGFYKASNHSLVAGECRSCASDCGTCEEGGVGNCLSCPSGKLLKHGSCVDSCGAGYYQVDDTCYGCPVGSTSETDGGVACACEDSYATLRRVSDERLFTCLPLEFVVQGIEGSVDLSSGTVQGIFASSIIFDANFNEILPTPDAKIEFTSKTRSSLVGGMGLDKNSILGIGLRPGSIEAWVLLNSSDASQTLEDADGTVVVTMSGQSFEGSQPQPFTVDDFTIEALNFTAPPTAAPVAGPTAQPTAAPAEGPSGAAPFSAPTLPPSAAPAGGPAGGPTGSAPTNAPTLVPTPALGTPTPSPTFAPTPSPTFAPTNAPTDAPSHAPTFAPTLAPTLQLGGSSGGGSSANVGGIVAGCIIGIILMVVAVVLTLWYRGKHKSATTSATDAKGGTDHAPFLFQNPVYASNVMAPANGLGATTEPNTGGSAAEYVNPAAEKAPASGYEYAEMAGAEASGAASPTYSRTKPQLRAAPQVGSGVAGMAAWMEESERGAAEQPAPGPAKAEYATLPGTEYQVVPKNAPQLYARLSSVAAELMRSDIQLAEPLGAGEFGEVYRGVLTKGGSGQQQQQQQQQPKQVAVKMCKSGSSEETRLRFLAEAAIIGQFSHPQVLGLVGVVSDTEPVLIVTELMRDSLLMELRSLRPAEPKSEEALVVEDVPRFVSFASDIVSGMAYLASLKFVHRDLAARNVLVDGQGRCKIADFGMARDCSATDYYTTDGNAKVPVKWTAPEALQFRKFSSQSDVWSFGVVLMEIWSFGHKPYGKWNNSKVFEELIDGFRLPPLPAMPLDVYRMAIQCWHPEAGARPTFAQLGGRLAQVRADVEARRVDLGNDAQLVAMQRSYLSSSVHVLHGSVAVSGDGYAIPLTSEYVEPAAGVTSAYAGLDTSKAGSGGYAGLDRGGQGGGQGGYAALNRSDGDEDGDEEDGSSYGFGAAAGYASLSPDATANNKSGYAALDPAGMYQRLATTSERGDRTSFYVPAGLVADLDDDAEA